MSFFRNSQTSQRSSTDELKPSLERHLNHLPKDHQEPLCRAILDLVASPRLTHAEAAAIFKIVEYATAGDQFARNLYLKMIKSV